MRCSKLGNSYGAFYSLATMIVGTVTIVVAVVVIGVYTGLFSDAEQNNVPMVGIKQETTFVLVTSIQNGPVHLINCDARIIEKATGRAVGNVTINGGMDEELNTGDTITITDINQGAYTIEILYNDNVVGNCQFNRYST